jgi:O-antigen ligase
VAFATLPISIDPGLTLVDLLKVLSYLAVYVVLSNELRTPRQMWTVVFAIVASTLVPTALAIIQAINKSGARAAEFEFFEFTRTSGTLAHPLSFAMLLLIPIIIGVSFMIIPRISRNWRIASLALVAFWLTGIYFTLARSVWIGLVLGLATLGLLSRKSLLVALPVVAGAALFLVPDIYIRFSTISLDPTASSVGNRFLYWDVALEFFRSSPLLGVGFGAGNLRTGYQVIGTYAQVHNDYLRLLVDTGLMGFTAYLVLMLAVAFESYSAHRSIRNPYLKQLAAAFLAIWMALLVVRVSDNVITNSTNQFAVWALAAVVQAARSVAARESARSIGDNSVSGRTHLTHE